MDIKILVVTVVLSFACGFGTREVIQHRQKTAAAPAAQTYTPSTAPVFAGQLHTNVIMSANGGRTVFVTR